VSEVTKKFNVKKFAHSINITHKHSDIRIQIQLDKRYQEFIDRANLGNILGYKVWVASIEDVLRSKVWAFLDETRRKSKRHKDLADIARLLEVKPQMESLLPSLVKKQLKI
jgi:hypothetical protein